MRLVCYGDSNTYGYDPRGYWGGRYKAEDRWPDLLAKRTDLEVVNLGTIGAEIPLPYHPLPTPDDHSPSDILLVMLGTNDLLQGVSAKEAAARMEAFLCRAIPLWNCILLIAPPSMKRGGWVAADALVNESIALGEEYRVISQKLNISFVDSRDWDIHLAFDGVHFSEEGHHSFAEKLGKELQPCRQKKSNCGDSPGSIC